MRKVGLLFTLGIALFCGMTWFFFALNAPLVINPPVELEIEPGESVRQIANRLERHDIVRSARILVFLTRIHGVDREIRHGRHEFAGAMTPVEVLRELARRPPQPTLAITIPEGLTWREIGALLEQEGILTAEDYSLAVCRDGLGERIGAAPQANCVEGYLFPDTYHVIPGTTAEQLVDLQLERFQAVSDELFALIAPSDGNVILAGAVSADEGTGESLSDPALRRAVLREGVILASIIEKETSIAEERALVSSVFHNRLRKSMRLQADPTVLYGFLAQGKDWDRKHLPRYLRTPGPYNTYTNDGLPPGPICNPGKEALRAALEPAPTDYLYFVASGNGAHRFSVTLAEHNRAVAQLRNQ